MTTSYQADFVRGGTSKGLLFLAEDLPEREVWPELFGRLMGSPDPYGRQLDGMGGGISSLSKVCVIAPPSVADADVDYTFAQVQVSSNIVDFSGNCGNMASAIGPFAVRRGLVSVAAGEACVAIHNTNTGKIIYSTFEVQGGVPVEEGSLEIPGVSGAAAPVRLEFLDPAGAATGKLLPTGKPAQDLILEDGRSVSVSIVDAANGCVFVPASELGLSAIVSPTAIESDPELIGLLLEIREQAAILMGLAESRDEARAKPMIPLVAIVSEPCDAELLTGQVLLADDVDIQVRMLSSGLPHRAIPMTGGLCVSAAARIPGSVVDQVARPDAQQLRVGTPSGVVVFDAAAHTSPDGITHISSGAILRTTRLLMSGSVHA